MYKCELQRDENMRKQMRASRGLFTHDLVPSERKVVELLLGISRYPRGLWRQARVSQTRPFFSYLITFSRKLANKHGASGRTTYLQVLRERITWESLRTIHVTHRSNRRTCGEDRYGALDVVNGSVRCSCFTLCSWTICTISFFFLEI